MGARTTFDHPLVSRYASPEMARLLSPLERARVMRRLWLALAEAQAALGLPITPEQLDALRATLDDIDLDRVAAIERELRHDVMAHVHAWGEQAPVARPILHLGATSCFVVDNADLVVVREGLRLLRPKLAAAVAALARFAEAHADLPTLGWTHLQPAQPTTVGKRACLWIQDLLEDLEALEHLEATMRFRGVKGTTGTQASFLALFDGDAEKVEALDRRVTRAFDFPASWDVTGQTYPRKWDHRLLATLAGLGVSASKMATDLRIAAHLKEVEEPFGARQVGSSAMAYKRNPMRSERICSLARHLVVLEQDAAHTAATQWMERTLDDSAIRRIALSEALLTADAILELLINVSTGLVVHPRVMARRLAEELPFMATETILMAMVRAGADRQEVHEAIRVHAMEAARQVKDHGRPNDLLDRLRGDPLFAPVRDRLDELLDPAGFVGLAPRQARRFLRERVAPVLERYPDAAGRTAELRV